MAWALWMCGAAILHRLASLSTYWFLDRQKTESIDIIILLSIEKEFVSCQNSYLQIYRHEINHQNIWYNLTGYIRFSSRKNTENLKYSYIIIIMLLIDPIRIIRFSSNSAVRLRSDHDVWWLTHG